MCAAANLVRVLGEYHIVAKAFNYRLYVPASFVWNYNYAKLYAYNYMSVVSISFALWGFLGNADVPPQLLVLPIAAV